MVERNAVFPHSPDATGVPDLTGGIAFHQQQIGRRTGTDATNAFEPERRRDNRCRAPQGIDRRKPGGHEKFELAMHADAGSGPRITIADRRPAIFGLILRQIARPAGAAAVGLSLGLWLGIGQAYL